MRRPFSPWGNEGVKNTVEKLGINKVRNDAVWCREHEHSAQSATLQPIHFNAVKLSYDRLLGKFRDSTFTWKSYDSDYPQ